MAAREIVWTKTAVLQRREILRYWTKRNGTSEYAKKLISLITKRINTIQNNPHSFIKADFADTQVSALGYFNIFYRVTDKAIIVTAFWDNRQNPTKLLEIMKENGRNGL